jgi:thiamine-monophosphate kinase
LTAPPNFDGLTTQCLFCDPSKHEQGHQVVLRSDSFYVFAGLGAIHEGYLLIAPYTCDVADGEYQSIALLPRVQLDELRFLREIVSSYYRDRQGCPGISFEHGRAGGCLISETDTRHCYHPHLCCYPVDLRLWDYAPNISVEEVDGLYGLAERVGSAPYLYMEHCEVHEDVPVHMASRERWEARVARLTDEDQLESQYLRRALASALGRDDRWDWQKYPTMDAVGRLVTDFGDWLAQADGLVYIPDDSGPRIDFARSVARSNNSGYDAISESYVTTWRRHIQHDAVARFVSRLPVDVDCPPRVLDLACGPGNYIKAFHHLGLRCVGTDISAGMLAEAQRELVSELADPDPPVLLRMDNGALAFAPGAFEGIWFSAGLVHMPRAVVRSALIGLREILVEGGVLYLSAQVGQGLTVRHEGRVFVYYTATELQDLLRSCGFDVVDRWDGVTDIGSVGDTRRKVWMHYLLTRAPIVSDQPAGEPLAEFLAGLGERALVTHIKSRLPEPSEMLILAAGDDAAAIATPPGSVLVATIDPLPQPVVSLLDEPDPWVDGWYSMIINLSDLAAMGATPIGALLAIEAPPTYRLADLDRFYDGALAAAHAFACPVIGGNIKDAERFNCVGVGLGYVRPERMLRRDAARPGEAVLVLGTMGVFWAAVLQSLRAIRVERSDWERLREALRRPLPRVREGALLTEKGWSRCAMDSSDGVTACLYEIAGSSGVDVHIDLNEVRADPVVSAVAEASGLDVRKLLLAWGDWQLLATAAPSAVGEIRAAMANLACPVWEIGWIGRGDGRVWLHEPGRTASLNYVASERFSPRSYFTHGIERYAAMLREQPLTVAANG